jgi:hypothetical protein
MVTYKGKPHCVKPSKPLHSTEATSDILPRATRPKSKEPLDAHASLTVPATCPTLASALWAIRDLPIPEQLQAKAPHQPPGPKRTRPSTSVGPVLTHADVENPCAHMIPSLCDDMQHHEADPPVLMMNSAVDAIVVISMRETVDTHPD